MIIYLSALVLSMFFCRQMQLAELHRQLTNRSRSSGWGWFFATFLILGTIVSTRNYVGTDYGNYIDVYSICSWTSYEALLQDTEALYSVLNRWCFLTFDDYLPVFAICGFSTIWLILYGIKRNSTSPWLSIFLFITCMTYFDLFNGMRQMISTAIMFSAYPLLQKKKWIPLLLLTAIASGFHASSYVILLVFLFSVYSPPNSPLSLLVILAFSAAVLLYGNFAESLIEILNATESKYINYEDTLAAAGYGANILRFALAAVPVIFGWFCWPVLRRQRKDVSILWNISLVNAMFMLLATRHWIFARFSMFFGVYNTLLWPEIIKCFDRRSRHLMIAGVLVVYFLYFWLIVHTDSNLLPYRSWLFGGVYG